MSDHLQSWRWLLPASPPFLSMRSRSQCGNPDGTVRLTDAAGPVAIVSLSALTNKYA